VDGGETVAAKSLAAFFSQLDERQRLLVMDTEAHVLSLDRIKAVARDAGISAVTMSREGCRRGVSR
jgi:hypothetical protein